MQLAPDMDGCWLTSNSSALVAGFVFKPAGVHEREMRKEKRNKRLFPPMTFLLVLCRHDVTVDALPFLSLDIDYILIHETIMREGVVQ